ncbi:MAG TPA: hypothetical protein GXZ40_09355, partial [Bacteroidales bacterium]|nr:hypothetical protein [Bacteroidales bacterium]
GIYPSRITTLPAEDITSMSAQLVGKVNTNITPLSSISQIGFEYKLVGTTHYTTVTANVADSFSTIVSNLSPCSTYTYRAFVTINQVTYYGDTLNFTLTSDPIIQIDTTICYGDTLTFLGREFSPAGWYYLTNNDTTYAINLQYFASRINSIYAEIEHGDSYIVNGVPYTTSGIYQAVFDTDANGCDSVVNLTLRVVYTAPSVWDGTSTPWVFGDGTAQNPYLIENAAQLAYMSSEINSNAGAYIGAYFDLVADIDLNGYNWAPIGTSANQFQGHFNGNDHTINDLNITVNGNNPQYVGLFGYVNNAEISNVHIIGNGTISVQGTNTTFYIGSIAGYAIGSTIVNCSNQSNLIVNHTGTTTSYNTYLGGLVGYLTGNTNPPTSLSYLTNSMNEGKINFNIKLESNYSDSRTWYHYIGGVVGKLDHATVENCGNLDSLFLMNDVAAYYKSSYIYAGGIAGHVYGTSTLPINIKKSYNKGKIILNNLAKSTGSGSSNYANAYGYIGGIIGYCNTGYITISDCYNRGDLKPKAYSYHSSYYNNSHNYVAGITGYLPSSAITITNCYNTGNVPSTYTPYGGNAGTGTIYYYHDCIGYNASTYTQTNNNYYLSTCECTVNATNAAATQMLTMKDPGMPVILNQGAPGSGIWQQDITIINDG